MIGIKSENYEIPVCYGSNKREIRKDGIEKSSSGNQLRNVI